MSACIVFELSMTNKTWLEKYLAPTAEVVAQRGGGGLAMGGPEKLPGSGESSGRRARGTSLPRPARSRCA